MGWLTKLPGGVRYPSHKEWQLLKRVPKWGLWGSVLFAAPVIYDWWQTGDLLAHDIQRNSMFLGLLFTYWFFIGVIIIGLIVIIIMKGPGYVADPYYLPTEDKSLENPSKKQ